MAKSPLQLRGPRRFKAGGQNEKWPTSGPDGYIAPTAWGGGGASQRFRAGDKIRSGPLLSKGATETLAPGGSPKLHSGGEYQRWPTTSPGGYITPAAWGVPNALEQGTKSEVGHKWARWLNNTSRLGVPNTSKREGKMKNQKSPTSGPGGYITPTAGSSTL